ncbi:MAG: type II CAAX endopeptidase family protein, partial [Acidimicrobiaceae bacterium]|nr:type II CAAX endopeptidase family protein [Acidimicrobiaceae bacterium]
MRPSMPATTRLTWAAAGWAAGFVASIAATVVALIVLPSAGDSGASGEELLQELSMVGLVALQVPLWLGLLGTPLLARRYGLDWRSQIRWRMRAIDVVVGTGIGLALQLVVVPLMYWPIFRIFGDLDVEGPARELSELAGTPLEVVLLVVMTVLLAPLTEEVFFRGLLQGALQDRLGPVWAVSIASVAFGITHFQVVQLPALVLVGV